MTKRIQQLADIDYYKLKIADGGTYVLDVGSAGAVSITGDLTVAGDVTQTQRNDLIVSDNTITLNSGQAGAGINVGGIKTAGIVIDRGTRNDAQFLFDEDLYTIRAGAQHAGAFKIQASNNDGQGIQLSSISSATNADIYIKPDNAVIKVSDTESENYERRIWPYTGSNISTDVSTADGLAAPNSKTILVNTQGLKDYVSSYYTLNYQDKLQLGSSSPTSVQVFDTEADALQTSRVQFSVDGTTNMQLFTTKLEVEDVKIEDNIISPISSTGDLILKAGSVSGNVKIQGYQNFVINADPGAPAAGTLLYSKALGDGGTGLYFKNEDGTADEFVSRNKALLYSIIF